MLDLLRVDTIAFTIVGYPMSYIELVGTLLYLASVWLIARKNMLTWPVGIVSVLLYMALFYQIRLYSDALEQVYYLVASVYGWWYWRRSDPAAAADDAPDFRYSRPPTLMGVAGGTLLVSLLVGALMTRIHLLLPAIFPEAASFPWLDALTTVMSFTAMGLLAQKRVESWLYWIIVDVIGIWLYFVKDVRFISLLYVILLGMAINGLLTWSRAVTMTTGETNPLTPLKGVGLVGLAMVVGYGLGLGGGWLLVTLFSTNSHDQALEAAMTGAFVVGPVAALAAGVIGAVIYRQRSKSQAGGSKC